MSAGADMPLRRENAELKARIAELELEAVTPMQPIVEVNGVHRFKANPIVQHLLDTHPSASMNTFAIQFHRDPEARSQFAQLVGYSVFGAMNLDYVSDETIDRAERACAALEVL